MKKERAADDTRGELPWYEHVATGKGKTRCDALTVTVDSELTHGCFISYTRLGASTC